MILFWHLTAARSIYRIFDFIPSLTHCFGMLLKSAKHSPECFQAFIHFLHIAHVRTVRLLSMDRKGYKSASSDVLWQRHDTTQDVTLKS